MNRLDCIVMEDLAPLYNEDLVNPYTSELIEAHLKECDSCNTLYGKTSKNIEVTFESAPICKRVLFHVYGIRIWYLLCPLLAFILLYHQFDFLLHLYTGALFLFTGICISSQFFSGITMRGFDMEQVALYNEAKAREKKKFGEFYSSPLSLCLPCILVLLSMITIETFTHI